MTARRKHQPQVSLAADEALELLRALVELQRQQSADIEAIRQTIERNEASDKLDAPAALEAINPEDLIAAKEAAHIAGVSDDTVRRWSKENALGVSVGGAKYISRSKLTAYLDTRRR